VVLDSCTFSFNKILGDSTNAEAAGLLIAYISLNYIDTAVFKITNCTFEENDAGNAGEGGGGFSFEDAGDQSLLFIEDCSFRENKAIAREGAAIKYKKFGANPDYEDHIYLTGCEFLDNSGDNSVVSLRGYRNQNFVLSDCSFKRNRTQNGDGAALSATGNTLISNSIFIENGENSASVVVLIASVSEYDSLIIDHCTFINN
jgi:hypothetical protein